MSNFIIAFLLAAGAATWVYSKTQRRTGGNTKSALIVTVLAGAAAFLITLSLLAFIPE